MNLENKVCSLELSRRLKELGVKRESLFCWTTDLDIEFLPYEMRNEKICIAAFTSDELLEMLPAWIDTKNNEPFNNFYLRINKRMVKNIQYTIEYICDSTPGKEVNNPFFKISLPSYIYDEKAADSLAKMIIYLRENNLMEVPT